MLARILVVLFIISALSACVPATLRGVDLDRAGNYKEAYQVYVQAAETGDPYGQVLLADMLAEGRPGIPKDNEKALFWLKKAADQNYRDAQFRFGLGYSGGRYGVKKDPIKAMRWFRKASMQGDRYSQASLASEIVIYNLKMKDGIRQSHPEADPVDGLAWAYTAIANGRNEVQQFVPGYLGMLTKEQIAEADKKAEEYKIKYRATY